MSDHTLGVDSEIITPRFGRVETALIFSSIGLLFSNYITLLGHQAIPILESFSLQIEISGVVTAPRIFAVFVFSFMWYMLFEWLLAPTNVKRRRRNYLRFYLLEFFAGSVLFIKYYYIFEGTQFENISRLWWLWFILLGEVSGALVSSSLRSVQMIRNRNEIFRYKLPKIPFFVKISLTLSFILSILLFAAIWATIHFYHGPRNSAVIFVLGLPIFVYLFKDFILLRTNKRKCDKLANAKKINDFIDYNRIMSECEPAFWKRDEILGKSPEECQQIAAEKCKTHILDREQKTKVGFNGALVPEDKTTGLETLLSYTHYFVNDPTTKREVRVPESRFKLYIERCIQITKPRTGPEMELVLQRAANLAINEVLLQERGISPLYYAIAKGSLEDIDVLIPLSNEINDLCENKWTSLLLAVANGMTNIVIKLIDAGADLEKANILGCTPLLYATRYNNIQLCRILLDSGAKINAQDIYGHTPLIVAALHGCYEVAELLLKRGANPNVRSKNNLTALSCAQDSKHGRIATLLRKAHPPIKHAEKKHR